jgi:hypothetical protein
VIIKQCKPPLEKVSGKATETRRLGPEVLPFRASAGLAAGRGGLTMTLAALRGSQRLNKGPLVSSCEITGSTRSSFLLRVPGNGGLWSPLLVLEVSSPTQCSVPTRHKLLATPSPIGLVTLAPIPTWQKCLHCLATCFCHLAFKCGLNLSLVTFRATRMLWFQASNTCSKQ